MTNDVNKVFGVVLIDGLCVLCSRSYRFVKLRDRAGQLRFVTVQSSEGRALAHRFGIDAESPDTFLLIRQARAYSRSDAVLLVLGQLRGWRWSMSFWLVPRFIRDQIYNMVVRNRYRWFGRRDVCLIPERPTADLGDLG